MQMTTARNRCEIRRETGANAKKLKPVLKFCVGVRFRFALVCFANDKIMFDDVRVSVRVSAMGKTRGCCTIVCSVFSPSTREVIYLNLLKVVSRYRYPTTSSG